MRQTPPHYAFSLPLEPIWAYLHNVPLVLRVPILVFIVMVSPFFVLILMPLFFGLIVLIILFGFCKAIFNAFRGS